MAALRERLPEDAILTCGAGNFTVWAHRYYEFTPLPARSLPRAAARWATASRPRWPPRPCIPSRPVVCLAGDGDFLMTGQELATAVQERLGVVVLVVNNGMYGTIRMHQERRYPGRVVGTDLVNPDFAAYARAFGAHGALVERSEDVARRPRRGAGLRAPRAARAARGPRGDHAAPDAQRDPGGRGMSRRELDVEGLAPPLSHYADAVQAGDALYISGIVPVDAEGAVVGDDVVAQARAGVRDDGPRRWPRPARGPPTSSRSRSTCSTSTTARGSTPCARSSSGTPARASTLVEVSRLAVPGARLEIEAVAHLGP